MSGTASILPVQSHTVAGIGQSFSREPSVMSIFPNAKMNLFSPQTRVSITTFVFRVGVSYGPAGLGDGISGHMPR